MLRYIDEGKNPQLYTKDCMEKALAKNEAVKGKIDVLKVCLQHRIEISVLREYICYYLPWTAAKQDLRRVSTSFCMSVNAVLYYVHQF